MEFSYRDRVPASGLDYAVTVQSEAGDQPADPPGRLRIALTGSRADGTMAIEGTLAMPADALTITKDLVTQVIGGLEHLTGTQPATRTKPATRVNQATNAGAPWTTERREQLRQAWLAENPSTLADDAIAKLAKEMGRTKFAVRSQLPRVHCDPDVPGRELP